MHKPRTPWPAAERAQLVGAFEGLRERYPGFSARRFSQCQEAPAGQRIGHRAGSYGSEAFMAIALRVLVQKDALHQNE